MPAAELISQAEYARRRGVDPTSVRDAVRAGRITLIDGKIDPAVADMQWQRNTRRRVRAIGTDPAPTGDIRLHEGASQHHPADVPDYQAARARREQAEAETAELKLRELRGELVRVDDIKSAHQRRVAAMRETFLQLPSRVVPLLLADSSPAAIESVLKREIAGALRQVVEVV